MKKILCVVLSVLLLMTTCVFAVAANEGSNDLSNLPENEAGTYRYFFYMPESWTEDGTYPQSAGIYFLSVYPEDAPWPGYEAKSTGFDGVYYYDTPIEAVNIVWNNYSEDDYDHKTANIGSEYYDSGESPLYPEGTTNFDGMIYVTDPEKTVAGVNGGHDAYCGEWFYYYGDGEYGLAEDKANAPGIITGDTVDLDAVERGEYPATNDEAPATNDSAETTPATEPTEPEEEPIFPDEVKPAGTNRYYFYLPDQWVNDYAYTAGIYWWEGSISGEYWPGNEAKSAGVDGVYYYDVAADTPTIIWNNHLDGGMDPSADVYTASLQTVDIVVSDGNYDGMIYIISLDKEFVNSYNGKVTYGGEWYYYYGSGQYGKAPLKADADEIFTNKSFGQWATPDETPTEPEVPTNPVRPTNPVMPTTPVKPTEPAKTEPTEPTEAVTEPSEVTEPQETTATEPTDATTTPTEPSEVTDPTDPEPEFSVGDANMDGKVNIRDATLIQKYLAKLLSLSDEQKEYADFDLNGKVNVRDVTAIQKKIAGLI